LFVLSGIDIGCIYDQQVLALASCSHGHGGNDCARARSATAKCSKSQSCHVALFGGSANAYTAAVRYAEGSNREGGPARGACGGQETVETCKMERERLCADGKTPTATIYKLIREQYFKAFASCTPFRLFNPKFELVRFQTISSG
jgi:hypothetical protein